MRFAALLSMAEQLSSRAAVKQRAAGAFPIKGLLDRKGFRSNWQKSHPETSQD